MKLIHLGFAATERSWPQTSVVDLMQADDVETFPAAAGAYVLGSSDGTMLTYPWGNSPVFYVGQSGNLRQRLTVHRDYIRQIARNPWRLTEYRYQYGAAFGASVAMFESKEPDVLEAQLIQKFYWCFGSIPVANSKWEEIHVSDAEGTAIRR